MDLEVLNELVSLHLAHEVLLAHVEVVLPVLLPWPHASRGVRNAEAELARVLLRQPFNQGALAHARGTQDNQDFVVGGDGRGKDLLVVQLEVVLHALWVLQHVRIRPKFRENFFGVYSAENGHFAGDEGGMLGDDLQARFEHRRSLLTVVIRGGNLLILSMPRQPVLGRGNGFAFLGVLELLALLQCLEVQVSELIDILRLIS